MFTFGDIVKLKFGLNGIEYFIVTDALDFSKDQDGSDMQYEIMRIFPAMKASMIANVDEKKIEIVAKDGTKDSRLILDFVMRKRYERGWHDTPDFDIALRQNRKAENGEGKAKHKDKDDVVRYDKLGSVDQCLDAMNDLQRLYNVFGDEAYLQLREVVQNRLKDLI